VSDEGGKWFIWVNNPFPCTADIILTVDGRRFDKQLFGQAVQNNLATVYAEPQAITAYWYINQDAGAAIRSMERIPSFHE
jgi:hypothetical protein